LTREQLLDAVSGRRAEPFDRSIDVLVGRLRRKIEPNAKAPRLIKTVPGVGYKFAVRPQASFASDRVAPEARTPAQGGAVQQAERRQLTVLRCAIDSGAALAARLDPEDWHDTVAAFRACCSEIVHKFGGAVTHSADDGVLAWFGYPEASEFDVEHAVRAGLAVVKAVSRLSVGAGASLRTRVGIASGLVIVGTLSATGQVLPAALGEPSMLASALLSHAPANAVLIAAATRKLVRGLFKQQAIASILAEGFAEPIEAWRVTDAVETSSRFLALRPATLSPLVGRDEELESLSRRWEEAKSGRGRIVFVTGEPGMGKSRLLHAFEQRASGATATILKYFCSPHHAHSALFPVIDQMEDAAGFVRADSAANKRTKLETLLATSGASNENVGVISNLLAVHSGGHDALPDMPPQHRKDATLRALLAHFAGLATRQPLIILYEDVHWIDPTSFELLSLLAERVPQLPLLLLVTARPEFRPPWAEEAHVATLTLRRLDRHEAEGIVAGVAADSILRGEVVEQILRHSDGVPLFVEELTRAVVETRDTLDRDVPSFVEVPASLRSSLLARLDRLGPAREVARIGAVIGREFDYDVLRVVAGLSEAELATALGRLVDSGLVLRRGDPPDARFLFKHVLVQDAAYSSLLRADRRSLHRRIAEVLEAQFSELTETQPELLGHHFTEAGMGQRAVRYLLKAGQQALGLSAMTEAAALLGKALTLIPTLPESIARHESELDLQIAIGQASIATLGYAAPAVGRAFARARALCETLKHTPKMLPILYGEWAYNSVADLIRARELATEIQQFSEQNGDPVAQVMSCRASGLTHLMLGNFPLARAYLEQGLASYDTAEQRSYASIYATTDPLIFFHSYLSLTLVCCGELDAAREHANSALAHARNLSHAHSRSFALHWTWVARWCAGAEPHALLAQANDLVTLAAQHSFSLWQALALGFRGWCLAALDQQQEAVEPAECSSSPIPFFCWVTSIGWPAHRNVLLRASPRLSGMPTPRTPNGCCLR
jgi:class 3 adenylate cyclase